MPILSVLGGHLPPAISKWKLWDTLIKRKIEVVLKYGMRPINIICALIPKTTSNFSFYMDVSIFLIGNRWFKTTSQDAQKLWEFSSNLTSQHIFPLLSYCKMSGKRSTLMLSRLRKLSIVNVCNIVLKNT